MMCAHRKGQHLDFKATQNPIYFRPNVSETAAVETWGVFTRKKRIFVPCDTNFAPCDTHFAPCDTNFVPRNKNCDVHEFGWKTKNVSYDTKVRSDDTNFVFRVNRPSEANTAAAAAAHVHSMLIVSNPKSLINRPESAIEAFRHSQHRNLRSRRRKY
jgi:hypothetical protein